MGNLENSKFVQLESDIHYIAWDGVKCRRCLRVITVRVYFKGELSTVSNMYQITIKCDCGVKIVRMNGIAQLIPRQIFDKSKHQAEHKLTIKEVIQVNNL